jgi:hypothetical protein
MKAFFYAIAILAITQVQAQQISNAGLEHWTITNIQVPDSFATIDMYYPFSTVTRTNDAHSGQYAAMLRTADTTYPPLLSYKSYLWETPKGGWPFTGRPDSLKFWYKYTAVGINQAHCDIWLTKWKNNARILVGTGYAIIYPHDTTSIYRQAAIPIYSFDNDQPDSISIQFTSSFENRAVGSTLYIDEISLVYPPTSTFAPIVSPTLLYPNPARDAIIVSLPGGLGTADITVLNTFGQVMLVAPHTSDKAILSTHHLPAGNYSVRILSNSQCRTTKLTIAH